ncbi:cytidine deaminase [Haliangium ochraceum]|uniref:Cytidine deaminase n=1 Tax=Haliangium ochraceum (strain DSM 14365 / JCM 11303 / SMP-2) TaxID=502025 RepID=D0LL70_HALO1|nr:cytidine deaminase [Haliangium ochraceum]ACY18566.1 cytidine deaminase [Haliangium ochraceum DSM 14365]
MPESERDELEALVARAQQARTRAYAPYSNFQVGCVLRAGGHVYEGANIENASYGLCLCAERTALAAAVYAGERALELVVVSSDCSPPATPCGMCRQALSEFCSAPETLRVVLVNARGDREEYTLADLLPHGFERGQLTAPREG